MLTGSHPCRRNGKTSRKQKSIIIWTDKHLDQVRGGFGDCLVRREEEGIQEQTKGLLLATNTA